MDTCSLAGAPSNAQIYELLLELKAEMAEKDGPTRRKNRAAWRDHLPTLEAMVADRGYVLYTDAEQLGLNNTEWDRCTADLIKAHPDWRKANLRHRKILHRPGVDVGQVELETIIYENHSSGDPKVLQHMVKKIMRKGRLNVLSDLQDNHPKTGEEWREKLLDNLTDYIKEQRLPIERERMPDGKQQLRFTDWFRKKDH